MELECDLPKTVSDLHFLSRKYHILVADLSDVEARLKSLQQLYNTYHSAYGELYNMKGCLMKRMEGDPVNESLAFLLSQVTTWKRWAENYNRRTSIRIHLCYNLTSQRDSRINLRIADLTAKISADAHKDNMSMNTYVGQYFPIQSRN